MGLRIDVYYVVVPTLHIVSNIFRAWRIASAVFTAMIVYELPAPPGSVRLDDRPNGGLPPNRVPTCSPRKQGDSCNICLHGGPEPPTHDASEVTISGGPAGIYACYAHRGERYVVVPTSLIMPVPVSRLDNRRLMYPEMNSESISSETSISNDSLFNSIFSNYKFSNMEQIAASIHPTVSRCTNMDADGKRCEYTTFAKDTWCPFHACRTKFTSLFTYNELDKMNERVINTPCDNCDCKDEAKAKQYVVDDSFYDMADGMHIPALDWADVAKFHQNVPNEWCPDILPAKSILPHTMLEEDYAAFEPEMVFNRYYTLLVRMANACLERLGATFHYDIRHVVSVHTHPTHSGVSAWGLRSGAYLQLKGCGCYCHFVEQELRHRGMPALGPVKDISLPSKLLHSHDIAAYFTYYNILTQPSIILIIRTFHIGPEGGGTHATDAKRQTRMTGGPNILAELNHPDLRKAILTCDVKACMERIYANRAPPGESWGEKFGKYFAGQVTLEELTLQWEAFWSCQAHGLSDIFSGIKDMASCASALMSIPTWIKGMFDKISKKCAEVRDWIAGHYVEIGTFIGVILGAVAITLFCRLSESQHKIVFSLLMGAITYVGCNAFYVFGRSAVSFLRSKMNPEEQYLLNDPYVRVHKVQQAPIALENMNISPQLQKLLESLDDVDASDAESVSYDLQFPTITTSVPKLPERIVDTVISVEAHGFFESTLDILKNIFSLQTLKNMAIINGAFSAVKNIGSAVGFLLALCPMALQCKMMEYAPSATEFLLYSHSPWSEISNQIV